MTPERKSGMRYQLNLEGRSPHLILFVVLGVAVVGAFGTLGYVASLPKGGEGFTQFYILGPEGRAENYPKEVVAGTEAEALVTIINQEHEAASYRLQVKINGVEDVEIGPHYYWSTIRNGKGRCVSV